MKKKIRNRWMKNVTVGALCFALTIGGLSGCGSDPQSDPGSVSGPAVSGGAGMGEPPSGDKPDGEPPEGGPGGSGDSGGPGGAPGGGQSSASDISYSAVKDITSDETITGDVSSTGTDESAVRVSEGATATVKKSTVTRQSSDSTGGDNASFYGVGAALLATEGTLNIADSTITSDSKGGAGAFSYGENSTVNIWDTTITTKQDTSGGIHAAGSGTLYAWNVTASTEGESSAAIRSDRGGGTMVVDDGTYTSNGTGSPAVYSTADISVNGAELTANGSEAVCIEGLNSLRLYDCNLTGNMPDSSQNDCTWNVILYQSMSGDSEVGNSTFEMQGGTLTAKKGGMFYTTNTESTFLLKNVKINYSSDNDFFLKVTGNSNERGWGSSGSNGAACRFTASEQEMQGDVVWDTISSLSFSMSDKSTLTGAIRDDESNAGSGGDGTCEVYIDKTSKWVVTGDSTVTKLYNQGEIVDDSGKTVTIKDTSGDVKVKGAGSYTITVSSYEETESSMSEVSFTNWSDVQKDKPSA